MKPERSEDNNPLLSNIGDGSINVKELHNNTTSHKSVNIYNGKASDEALLEQKKEKFRDFFLRNVSSGSISPTVRRTLDYEAHRLGLDAATQSEIEMSLLQLDCPTRLSDSDRVSYGIALDAVRKNELTREILTTLLRIADRCGDDEVSFYANLALAVREPGKLITRYNEHPFDSYWQAFWAYMAFKCKGKNDEASKCVDVLNKWDSMPSDNISVLNAAGNLYSYVVGGEKPAAKHAVGFLLGCNAPSPELKGFIGTMGYILKLGDQAVPLYYSDNSELNFYLNLFGARQKPAANMNDILDGIDFGASTTDTPALVPNPAPKPAPAPKPTPATSFSAAPASTYVPPKVSIPPVAPPRKTNYTGWIVVAVVALLAYLGLKNCGGSDREEAVTATTVITETGPNPIDNGGATTTDGGDNTTPGAGDNNGGYTKTDGGATTNPGGNNSTAPDGNKDVSTTSEHKKTDYSEPVKPKPVLQEPQPSPFEILVSKAQAGDAGAMCDLGIAYLDGDGVAKSNKKAFEWFSASARAGCADGMYWLGYCYKGGRGTEKDKELAKEWFGKAAARGHSNAAKEYEDLQSLM